MCVRVIPFSWLLYFSAVTADHANRLQGFGSDELCSFETNRLNVPLKSQAASTGLKNPAQGRRRSQRKKSKGSPELIELLDDSDDEEEEEIQVR